MERGQLRMLSESMSYHQLPITANVFFELLFFLNKNYWAAYSNRSCQLGLLSNQFRLITQTSSGIKMNKIELRIYWTFTVQLTFKLRWKLQKTPTNRKYFANLAQQFGNVMQIQRNKLSNVYFLFWGFTLNREPQTPNLTLFMVISLHYQLSW